jgi:hypothetical protein
LLKRLLQEARTRSVWRQLAYHLLSPVINVIGFLMVIGVWAGSLIAVEFAVQGWILEEYMIIAISAPLATVLLVAGPWVALGVTALDVDSPPGGPTTIRVELPCE